MAIPNPNPNIFDGEARDNKTYSSNKITGLINAVDGRIPEPEVSDIGKVLGVVADGTGAKLDFFEPSGSGLDDILTAGVISDTSAYRTATFDDISDYDTIIVRIYNPYNDTISFYENIIRVSDIPDSGLSFTATLSPNNVDCKIDKTSIKSTNYRGAYRYIYADIIGSADPLFPEVNI